MSHQDRSVLSSPAVEQEDACSELKACGGSAPAPDPEPPPVATRLEATRAELKRAEEAREFLASIVDSSEDSIVTINFDATITTWNAAAERLYGCPAAEAIGKPFSMLKLPKDLAEMLGRAVQVGNGYAARGFDTIRVHEGGRERWLSIALSPVKNREGKVIGISTIARDVSERKGLEKVLAEERDVQLRMFTAVMSSTQDFIYHFDVEGHFTFANQPLLDLWQQTLEEAVGKDFHGLKYPRELANALQAQIAHVVATGKPFRGRTPYTSAVGTRQYEYIFTPLLRADGMVESVAGVTRDITVHTEAEAALRAAEERLRLIVENAREYAIFSMDLEMKVTSWNPGAERLLGFTEAEILGKNAEILFTPEDRAAGAPEAEQTQARSEGRATDERWHMRKDGSRFWGSGYLMLMRGEDGEAVGFGKILRDLTVAKQTEEKIRSGEERFRALIHSVKDYAIYTLDAHGLITDWNSGAEQIQGYKAEEVIGRSIEMFYPPETLAENLPQRELATAAAQGQSEAAGWIVRKDGSRFCACETVTALHDDRGQLMGFAKVCRDLTERNQAEEALREAKVELEKRVRARTAELRRANTELSSEMALRYRLEKEILVVSEREQRRIGQDLHDGVCQELAANAMMTGTLAKRLAQKHAPESKELAKISGQINDAVARTRGIARGLHPVEMDANGLMSALGALADGVDGGITCELICKTPVLVHESNVALNLYRIAQEAVANAVKHSKGTRIVLELTSNAEEIRLVIRDNGTWRKAGKKGMGLDIMNYRARTIGASISVAHPAPRGTSVTCLLPAN